MTRAHAITAPAMQVPLPARNSSWPASARNRGKIADVVTGSLPRNRSVDAVDASAWSARGILATAPRLPTNCSSPTICLPGGSVGEAPGGGLPSFAAAWGSSFSLPAIPPRWHEKARHVSLRHGATSRVSGLFFRMRALNPETHRGDLQTNSDCAIGFRDTLSLLIVRQNIMAPTLTCEGRR